MGKRRITLRSKSREPKKAGDILKDFLSSRGLENIADEERIISSWQEIVGEEIFSVTEILKIERGIMFLKVPNPSWRTELIFLKKELLEKVNGFAGKKIIKDLFLCI
jgi:predicted nucleic acid-binding Zn ribbon protein